MGKGYDEGYKTGAANTLEQREGARAAERDRAKERDKFDMKGASQTGSTSSGGGCLVLIVGPAALLYALWHLWQ